MGVLGDDRLIGREALVAVGGVLGIVYGRFERSRIGRWMTRDLPEDQLPADLTAEFRDSVHRFDHREEAFRRRTRL